MSREADALMRYTMLFLVFALAVAGLILLAGCSAEYTRENGMRNGVVTDLHKYCLEYPKDSACQGPNSK